MSNPCIYCSKLTVELLLEAADERGHPSLSYYKHHNSFSDLEAAAFAGCDLCRLALECFLQRNLYEKARNLEPPDVKVWVEMPFWDPHEPSAVLNTIVFRVGEASFEGLDLGEFAEVEVGLIAKEGIADAHGHQ